MLNSGIPQPGQRFNPHRTFGDTIIIPIGLLEAKEIYPGAKLVYGRLLRFAGRDGLCYPSVETLANGVGMSVSQVKRCLKFLEGLNFIQREHRFSKGRKTSNGYYFLWHYIFDRE